MIIGLTGYKGCGKDTLASLLVEREGFIKMSFADKLREVCSDVFGIPMEWFLDSHHKDSAEYHGKTPREILIIVGECMRSINPNVWVDVVMDQCRIAPSLDYVISDVRHENEANAILDNDGIILRIERNGCELGNDLPNTGLYLSHPDLPVVENNGTLDDLLENTLKMIDHVLEERNA